MDRREQRGFTLMELLVVIAIIGITLGAAFPFAFRLYTSAKAVDASTRLEQITRQAQIRTLTKRSSSAYGVYVLPHELVLYQGTAYTTRDSQQDIITQFGDDVTLSTDIIDNDIRFVPGTGQAVTTGTVLIQQSESTIVYELTPYGQLIELSL